MTRRDTIDRAFAELAVAHARDFAAFQAGVLPVKPWARVFVKGDDSDKDVAMDALDEHGTILMHGEPIDVLWPDSGITREHIKIEKLRDGVDRRAYLETTVNGLYVRIYLRWKPDLQLRRVF